MVYNRRTATIKVKSNIDNLIKTNEKGGLGDRVTAQVMENGSNIYKSLDEEMLYLRLISLLPNLESLCHNSIQ